MYLQSRLNRKEARSSFVLIFQTMLRHNRSTIVLLAAGALLLAAGQGHAQSAAEKLSAALKRVYGEAAQWSTATATLTEQQIAAVRASAGVTPAAAVTYYAVAVGGKRVGYGMVDDVKGKVKMITYVVLVDNAMTIRDLEVLAYREPYGGEVQYDAFRRQFRGKGARDAFKVGVDIRNISGATISSNAVTTGTRKVIAILNVLKASGGLH